MCVVLVFGVWLPGLALALVFASCSAPWLSVEVACVWDLVLALSVVLALVVVHVDWRFFCCAW